MTHADVAAILRAAFADQRDGMASMPAMELGTVNHVTCMDEYTAAVKAAADALVVVDFGAQWCGPCKRIAPLFDQLAATHTDVCFLKVDVDEAQDVAATLGVTSLPTFLFLRRGRTLETFSGADSARLESTIARLHPAAVAAPSSPAPAPAAAAKSAAPTVATPSAASIACSASFFKGDVTSAITAARTQRRPLLVAVDAPPPHADSVRQEAEVWNDAAVQAALSQCVALRLRADSQEGRQFASLFPVLALPFVYLINPLTGAPFAALPGFTSAATLIPAIASAVATLSAPVVLAAAPAAASTPAAPPAVAPTSASEAAPAPPSAELNDPASVEAEKARLLRKLAEVRAAKERATQEEEKEREVRRLQEAKEAQKAKEASEERRRQLALEKAAREREADERAKARLREQIRLDRLERAKGANAAAPPAAASAPPAAPVASSPAASAPAAAASSARVAPTTSVLQVRLTDGSAVKFELPSSAPLSEVRSVLISKHGLRGAFTLLTPYPRRNYTPVDEARSLADLGLTGAVTLIVTLPEGVSSSSPGAPAGAAQGGAPASAQGWGSYLWSWVTWSSPASAPQPSTATVASAPPSSSTPAPRPGGSGPQIRTLRDQKGDEDEDRKTWNGNSTQQM